MMTMFLKRIAVLMLVLVTVLTSTVLTDLSVEAASAATKETVLYQLPGQAPRSGGDVVQHMSYVFKTVNGKIIVIDGGNYAGDGPYLYAFLQKITGKTKPHVDAWFITHPHSDHYGALNWIYDNKLNNITVDTFYYNFPSQEQVNTYCVASAQGYTNIYIATIESWFTFFKNSGGETSNIIKVRSIHNNKVTSTFDIDDVHIEVLLTYHDVFWGADNISTVYSGTATSNGKAYTNQTIKTLLANDFVNNLKLIERSLTDDFLALGKQYPYQKIIYLFKLIQVKWSPLSHGIVVQIDGMIDVVIPIELVPQQTPVFKRIGQHIVPCLTFILRPHRIVRKQDQTSFQIFKVHIGRILIFPT